MAEFFLRRDEIAEAFKTPRGVRAFEDLQRSVVDTAVATTAGLAATDALKDATFVTLSANTELPNERVLSFGSGLGFTLTDGGIVLRLTANVPQVTGGFQVLLAASGDCALGLPLAGFLATRDDINDAAGIAAWGGISGSIAAQTDLQAALDAKLPVSTSAIAGEILNGQRAVYVADDGKAYLADQSSAASVRTMGLCQGAVILGATASIQTGGVLTEPSWSWTGDALVWLAASGQLTQTPPTTGYLVKVGVPVGPTKLLIAPQIIARLT